MFLSSEIIHKPKNAYLSLEILSSFLFEEGVIILGSLEVILVFCRGRGNIFQECKFLVVIWFGVGVTFLDVVSISIF